MTIYKMTLTPNRATGPRRTARIVMYRQEVAIEVNLDEPLKTRLGRRYVVPYALTIDEDGRSSAEMLRWNQIRDSDVDPEFEQAWLAHVAEQGALPAA